MKRIGMAASAIPLFSGASYVSALPKRWPPLMLSHSGGVKD